MGDLHKAMKNDLWNIIFLPESSKLYQGPFQPQGVKQVKIPKPNGDKLKLGIPTVTDMIIQQAIPQMLSTIYERQFSDHSYGFCLNRSARFICE